MMKAIQKPVAERGFVVADIDRPEYGPEDVLIKIRLASICGTDLHITEWDEWSASRIHPPLIYGHEFCGNVEAVGSRVTHVEPGDYVSAEMHIPCEMCYQCLIGNRHICENVKIAGIDLNGCYAGYIVLPKNQVIKLPKSIPPEYGACLDSLGNAVHAVSAGNVSGKSVLVTGCGPVGLFSIAVAKALGATRIYASDISEYRLDLARKAGCTEALKADKVNVPEFIQQATKNRGVDVVLEMSGNPHALKNGFAALGLAGTMVLLGIPKSTVEVDISRDIIFKEAKVLGINGREIFKTWFLMLDLLETGKLNIEDIITHRFKLHDFGDAIALVASGQSGKVLLEP
jgi:threonine 3-dehydrogenase